MNKPTISVDFDGVLHSYTSGWKGARTIPDPPVPGAIPWLCSMLPHFDVAISSARSGQLGGRWAMKRWIAQWAATAFLGLNRDDWMKLVNDADYDPGMDPVEEEARHFGRHLVRRIQWPRLKPSAVLYIDDRAHCFEGTFPSAEQIQAFKPWNKR